MKTLYVLRHAKSDWDDPALSDFDRPLNERGRRAAKAIGREMLRRGIEPDLVLASPAVRAQQTLERVQEAFGSKFRVTVDRRIYMAEPALLIDLVRSAPGDAERVMIVGHNPGLQHLVLALAEPSDLRREAGQKFPTAALAAIGFDCGRWSEMAPGTGRLEAFIRPREL